MVDDIRPPYEDAKDPVAAQAEPNQNEQTDSYKPPYDNNETGVERPVDSLIGNSNGGIAINGGLNSKKATVKKFFSRGLTIWPSTKKQKIAGGIIMAVLIIGGSGGVYALKQLLSKNEPTPAPVVEKKPEPPPKTTEPSKLTGVEIPIETNKLPVISIQIENSPDARPQAGLIHAGVVFEAIAEGGITRFNASFLEGQPDYIGPIRSVRPYYAALASPFDPVFVHAGGSADGLAKIRDLGLKDFDHGANGGAFQRVRDRFAPHNLYSSTAAIRQAAAGRGYNTSDTKGFKRKAEAPSQQVTARSINIGISGPRYDTHYDYNPATNSYNRVMAGAPHTDHRSGTQISPKVVVALVMGYSKAGIYSVYNYNGQGQMFVFQDGTVTEGVWKKASDKEQFEFVLGDGRPLELNAGQTWFTLVGSPGAVTHAP